MLAATFAMAVARLNEWRINFKPHAATQTTPANDLAHPRPSTINPQVLNKSALGLCSETRSTFYVFVKECEDVMFPLGNRKVQKIVPVVRCSANGRIDFQDVWFVQTPKFVSQFLT